MASTSFSPQLFAFLRDLEANNNRPWFNRHKTRFVEQARDPLLEFISALSWTLPQVSPNFRVDPRPYGGSMFRIYRDTRFSKDKRPYKTHLAARFPHAAATKGSSAPGFYLSLQVGGGYGAAGLWHPEQPLLTKIRHSIIQRADEWKTLRRQVDIEGARLKRPPRGFPTQHPLVEDLKLKDFVSSVRFSEEELCRPNFLGRYLQVCRQLSPLVRFLSGALDLPFQAGW